MTEVDSTPWTTTHTKFDTEPFYESPHSFIHSNRAWDRGGATIAWQPFASFKTAEQIANQNIDHSWFWPERSFKSWEPMHPMKPLKRLHHHPEVQARLSTEQKETFDILDRRYLGMPSHALKAAAFHFAKRCDLENQLYVLAKSEFKDPRSALRQGAALSDCAENTFRFILNNCPNSFKHYARCIEVRGGIPVHCRFEQFGFDKCMYEHGQDKARLGAREVVIDDKLVPWEKPLNPLNCRIAPTDPENNINLLRDHHSLPPDNEAFRDYIIRKKAFEEAREASRGTA